MRPIAEEAAQFPVSLLCRALGVTRRSYAELALAHGVRIGRTRVARLMRALGIFGAAGAADVLTPSPHGPCEPVETGRPALVGSAPAGLGTPQTQ